jgi:hypothetical protein
MVHTSIHQPGDILLKDWADYIQTKVGREQWVTVYSTSRGDWGASFFLSAFIPNDLVEECLEDDSWDYRYGNGHPGCTVYGHGDDSEVKYHRFGNDRGIEPLIICREFHGVREDYVEISEELRLFHNLYYDRANNKYLKFDDSGNEEDVIVIEDGKVKIKLLSLQTEF